jgi:hypothetical protein
MLGRRIAIIGVWQTTIESGDYTPAPKEIQGETS